MHTLKPFLRKTLKYLIHSSFPERKWEGEGFIIWNRSQKVAASIQGHSRKHNTWFSAITAFSQLPVKKIFMTSATSGYPYYSQQKATLQFDARGWTSICVFSYSRNRFIPRSRLSFPSTCPFLVCISPFHPCSEFANHDKVLMTVKRFQFRYIFRLLHRIIKATLGLNHNYSKRSHFQKSRNC